MQRAISQAHIHSRVCARPIEPCHRICHRADKRHRTRHLVECARFLRTARRSNRHVYSGLFVHRLHHRRAHFRHRRRCAERNRDVNIGSKRTRERRSTRLSASGQQYANSEHRPISYGSRCIGRKHQRIAYHICRRQLEQRTQFAILGARRQLRREQRLCEQYRDLSAVVGARRPAGRAQFHQSRFGRQRTVFGRWLRRALRRQKRIGARCNLQNA